MVRWRGILLGAVLAAAVTAPAVGEGREARTRELLEYGQAAEARGDLDRALHLYEQAATVSRDDPDVRWRATALLRQGVVLGKLSRHREAVAAERAAADLYHQATYPIGEASAWWAVGESQRSLQQAEEARRAFERCLAIARSIADHEIEAAALQGLGEVCGDLGRPEQALGFFRQGVAVCRASGDESGLARLLRAQGRAALMLRWLELARSAYQESLQLSRKGGNASGQTLSWLGLSRVFDLDGHADEALAAAQQARTLARAEGLPAIEAEVQHQLGHLYLGRSRYREAHDAYDAARTLCRQLHDPAGECHAACGLGVVLTELNRFDEALRVLQEALSLAQRSGSKDAQAAARKTLGDIYVYLGRNAEAAESYAQAQRLFHDLGDRRGEADCLSHVGFAQTLTGRPVDGVRTLQQACDQQHELGDVNAECQTLGLLGNALFALGDLELAAECSHVAYCLSRGLGEARGEAGTLSNLMEIAFSRHQARLSTAFGKQAANVQQRLRNETSDLPREMRKGIMVRQNWTAFSLADALLVQSRCAEAVQVLDRGHDESLFVHPGSGAGASQSPVAISPEEARCLARLQDTGDRFGKLAVERGGLLAGRPLSAAAQRRLAELEEQLNEAGAVCQRTMADMTAALAAEAPASERLEPPECAAFRAQLGRLGPGVAAVYTACVAYAVCTVVVTPQGYQTARTALSDGDLVQSVARFRAAVSHPAVDPRPAGQALYHVLLEPIASVLQQDHIDTILWCLDGQLRYVPVNALWDGQHYLIERYLNVNITPLSKEHLLDQPATQWTGVGFGVSQAHASFGALPFVSDELRGIIGPVVTGESALDERFTAASLRAALARHPQVVHIATHFAAGRTAADSKLLLGDGTTLSLAEVAQWNNAFAGVELLALSACETAISKEDNSGVEVDALGAVAQQQGAKAVLASLWPVADATTSVLMCDFYARREARPALGKGEAFRQAQLALLRGQIAPTAAQMARRRSLRMGAEALDEPAGVSRRFEEDPQARFAHPFYWAPFVLTGNYR